MERALFQLRSASASEIAAAVEARAAAEAERDKLREELRRLGADAAASEADRHGARDEAALLRQTVARLRAHARMQQEQIEALRYAATDTAPEPPPVYAETAIATLNEEGTAAVASRGAAAATLNEEGTAAVTSCGAAERSSARFGEACACLLRLAARGAEGSVLPAGAARTLVDSIRRRLRTQPLDTSVILNALATLELQQTCPAKNAVAAVAGYSENGQGPDEGKKAQHVENNVVEARGREIIVNCNGLVAEEALVVMLECMAAAVNAYTAGGDAGAATAAAAAALALGEQASWSLGSLLARGSDAAALRVVEMRGATTLISVLRRLGPANAGPAEAALRALAILASAGGETVCERLMGLGAATCVVGVMRAHVGLPYVQSRGCAAIAALGIQAGARSALSAAGAAEAISAALCCCANEADSCAEAACAAVRCLAAGNSGAGGSEEAARLVELGSVEAVLAAMAAHPYSARLQADGCCALRLLAHNHDSAKARLTVGGGAEAAVAAMRLHTNSAAVQEQACWVLVYLAAAGAPAAERVWRAGGVDAVLTAMQLHPANEGVQGQACWALANMAGNSDESARRLADCGGAEAVVSAMMGHPSSLGVQAKGCRALCRAASASAAACCSVREAGGVEAVMTAMRTHRASATVQSEGAAFLKAMAGEFLRTVGLASAPSNSSPAEYGSTDCAVSGGCGAGMAAGAATPPSGINVNRRADQSPRTPRSPAVADRKVPGAGSSMTGCELTADPQARGTVKTPPGPAQQPSNRQKSPRAGARFEENFSADKPALYRSNELMDTKPSHLDQRMGMPTTGQLEEGGAIIPAKSSPSLGHHQELTCASPRDSQRIKIRPLMAPNGHQPL